VGDWRQWLLNRFYGLVQRYEGLVIWPVARWPDVCHASMGKLSASEGFWYTMAGEYSQSDSAAAPKRLQPSKSRYHQIGHGAEGHWTVVRWTVPGVSPANPPRQIVLDLDERMTRCTDIRASLLQQVLRWRLRMPRSICSVILAKPCYGLPMLLQQRSIELQRVIS